MARILLVLSLLISVEISRASEALNQPYRVTVGDMVALQMTNYIRGEIWEEKTTKWGELAWKKEVVCFANYDPEYKAIVVTATGNYSAVEDAKRTLDNIRILVMKPKNVEFIRKAYGIEFLDGDLAIIYVNRKTSKKIIIRVTSGRYVLPE